MKILLTGEAWLEFKIVEKNGEHFLQQTAAFRPKGLLERLYWYSVLPFHFFVFDGMAKNLVDYKSYKNQNELFSITK